MAKAKNYKNEISKQNLDNYSQYNNGQTNLLGSPGFGRSMSKLVQGVAYLQSNRELKIHIFYKSEAGYDVVTNVNVGQIILLLLMILLMVSQV